METMDVFQLIALDINSDLGLLIIPTVMIPLTAVSVLLTMIATFIAGLFGITLKAEGPKKLLEVLFKPKILISAILLNGLILGGIWGYEYFKNLPSFIYTIEKNQTNFAASSNIKYEDVLRRPVIKDESNASFDFKDKNIAVEWSIKLPKGVFRSPIISSGRMFVGSIDGNIYEIDPAKGEIVRKFFVGTFVSPALTIYNNILYSGEGTHHTHHARIYAFDLKTGKLKDTYETMGHTEGSPVIAKLDGEVKLFAPSGSDGLHAIDLKNMKKSWKVFDGHIDASVYVENDKVFTGTGREKGDASKHRSYSVAYDYKTGKKLWQNELPASSWMSPTAWDDNVCFVFGEVYFKSGIGGVNCYNQANGLPTKSYNLNAPITGMPTVVGNSLFISDAYGRVCSLDLKGNKVSWCKEYKAKGRSFASPVYDKSKNIIVYASKSKGLLFLDPKTGDEVFSWNDEKGTGKEKKSSWKSHFAGALPYEGGYILSDITGNVRKVSLK
jgi:outer membrane protein assembly factor BamB